ncbi:hypothetical protein PGB34_03170 [Xenophilus arseniciresistens]|uniref:Uncharacterized protein n=1 Tax=Xenophilus arseniciresistens TaxID=1283306 RepID=A0AAE3SYC6_9BURK|nr:hypothetical protein [Xenophilus arseniciresistens]MDA7415355.1 hypothetical protein [Xenophilus arseniciresistens]
MALQGRAALAMWWDMASDALDEFAHWHAHEHFPERLGIPGFRRASRWVCAQGGEGIFVLYELESHAVLGSAPYLARLNAPSPWSQRMMPHHRNMVRSQCHVLESVGGCTAQQMLTVRLAPAPGQAEALRAALRALGEQWAQQSGGVGLHLLRHEAPVIGATEEQRIRGLSDQVADWVLLVVGYDAPALQQWAREALSDSALARMGTAAQVTRSSYALAYAAVPEDVTRF